MRSSASPSTEASRHTEPRDVVAGRLAAGPGMGIDVHLAEAHAVQPLDENAHTPERPQPGAEVVCHGALPQRRAQRIGMPGIQLRRPAVGHRSQRFDAAFVEADG